MIDHLDSHTQELPLIQGKICYIRNDGDRWYVVETDLDGESVSEDGPFTQLKAEEKYRSVVYC